MSISEKKQKWTETAVAKTLTRSKERYEDFRTTSDIEIERCFTPEEYAGYEEKLGFPGQYPYTRGVQPTMYRGQFWTMRQYAGFGNAAESNERYKYLLGAGQTGLSIAFDLPTQMGYDSDAAMSQGEVGLCLGHSLGMLLAATEDPAEALGCVGWLDESRLHWGGKRSERRCWKLQISSQERWVRSDLPEAFEVHEIVNRQCYGEHAIDLVVLTRKFGVALFHVSLHGLLMQSLRFALGRLLFHRRCTAVLSGATFRLLLSHLRSLYGCGVGFVGGGRLLLLSLLCELILVLQLCEESSTLAHDVPLGVQVRPNKNPAAQPCDPQFAGQRDGIS